MWCTRYRSWNLFCALALTITPALLALAGCDDDSPCTPGGARELPGPVVVHSQTELAMLAGVRIIHGTLTIDSDPADPVIDLSPLATLRQVDRLELRHAPVPSLAGLDSAAVSDVQILDCDRLQDLSHLFPAGIPWFLALEECDSLVGVNLSADPVSTVSCNHCPRLETLVLAFPSGAPGQVLLVDLPRLRSVAVTAGGLGSAVVWECPALDGFDPPGDVSRLEQLQLRGPLGAGFLASLPELPALVFLEVDSLSGMADPRSLPAAPALEGLALIDLPDLTRLTGLSAYPHLQHLRVSGHPLLTDAAGADSLPELQLFRLTNNPSLVTLPSLAAATHLQSCTIEQNSSLASLAPLAGHEELRVLHVEENSALGSLDGLAALPALEYLQVSGNGLAALGDLGPFPALSTLFLRWENSLTSLAGLEFLAHVDSLKVENCDGLASLDGLQNLRSAALLSFRWNDSLSRCAVDSFAAGMDSVGTAVNEGNAPCPD